ncbi:hypothetical protein D3C71_1927150 [compost metagenome]
MPGLLAGGTVTFLVERGAQVAEIGRVLMLLAADQQVQVRLRHASDQFGPLECQAFGSFWFHDH